MQLPDEAGLKIRSPAWKETEPATDHDWETTTKPLLECQYFFGAYLMETLI